jgi:hypothetical protein
MGEQWSAWQGQWALERELEAIVSGTGPIMAGPWLSEVGYEVLYWVPFLRWVAAAYRIPPTRFVAVSRGGTASWYVDVAGRYVEILDHIAPADLAARAAGGGLKQRELSDLDRQLTERVRDAAGLGQSAAVLHPSLMFRWFAPFWSGHESLSFVERHSRHARVTAPQVDLPVALPDEYIAVKFYAAKSLPDTPVVRAQLRQLCAALAERCPVVQLDTGLGLDDHEDIALTERRSISLRGHFDPRTNLAVQTRVVAGAKMFVGTCGGLAWLAPLLGVQTIPVFTDDSFLHAHLHVARRVYGRVGGGAFSPVDLSGLVESGLAIARAESGGEATS